ncbi:MAG: MFS transporter, partial [Bacteroidales bacterium]|nr:MFS transporter [Bacteroidales bacterium]
IFFVDVFTALLSIVFLFFIPVKHNDEQKTVSLGYSQEIKQGLQYARKNIFVREMLILYAFYFLLISPAAFLSPLMVARVFGEEVWKLTANEIAFSLGTMFGGLLIAKWNGEKNRINAIALSCFIIGITNLVLGLGGFYIFLVMMLVMGIFASFFSSIEMTLFQERVEENMQGRVFSLVQMVATTVMPVGMLLFGPLSDIVNVRFLFVFCGILTSVLGMYIFWNKRLKKAVGE